MTGMSMDCVLEKGVRGLGVGSMGGGGGEEEYLNVYFYIHLCAGLLITGSLVRTHSGASFVINFASLSPTSAWPSLA